MAKQRYAAQEIIHKLREADVLIGVRERRLGRPASKLGVTDKTYFRGRKSHGGPRIDQAKRMRELESKNARLTKAIRVPEGDACSCAHPAQR